jgi:hypothetical protein
MDLAMYHGYVAASSGQGWEHARQSSREDKGKGISEEADLGGVRDWDSVPEVMVRGVEAPLDAADDAAFLRRNFSRSADGSLSMFGCVCLCVRCLDVCRVI